MEVILFGSVVGLFFWTFFWFAAGMVKGESDARKEAVKANVGGWLCHPKTGKSFFTWNWPPPPEMKSGELTHVVWLLEDFIEGAGRDNVTFAECRALLRSKYGEKYQEDIPTLAAALTRLIRQGKVGLRFSEHGIYFGWE